MRRVSEGAFYLSEEKNMADQTKEKGVDAVLKEDPETVIRIAQEIIEPALQEALKKACMRAALEISACKR